MRILGGVAASLVLAAGVPAPARAATSPGAPVITPVQAGAVVDTIWAQREAALAGHDQAAIAALETASALGYDRAWLAGMFPSRPGGNGPRPLYGQLDLVPEQYAYPASFLAIVGFRDAGGGPDQPVVWTEVIALTKADSRDSWRIAFEAQTWDPLWQLGDEIGAAGQGYASVSGKPLQVDASTIPTSVAHRYRAWQLLPDGSGSLY